MSLLWRDQLRIVLCPDKVIVVRLGKGLRPQIKEKLIWHCVPATTGMPWQSALNTLNEKMVELGKGANADVVIILSNHFVRYALLPWSEQLKGPEEEQALARIYFEKIYGSLAATWALRISEEGYGVARIASAIDQMLLDGLSAVFASTPLHLASVQPYLMAAYNQWRYVLKDPNTCFVVAETGKVCIAMISDKNWWAVRSMQIHRNLKEEVLGLIEREMLLAGLKPGKVFFYAPDEPGLILPTSANMDTEPLKLPACVGFSPYTDAQFGMALSGTA